MNKITRYLLLLAALTVTLQPALADVPVNYYNSAYSKSDEQLMTALRNIINSHKQLSYNALWDAFKTTDTDAQGYIIDMYSNCRYKPTEHGGSASNVGEGFNREHSFPKSWFDDGTPMYTDLFHLYPTDIRVNNQRSNYPFGVCGDDGNRLTYKEWYGKGRLGPSIYPGYSGTVFEPDDEYKGDFARTYFYMVTCYKNELPNWSGSAQLNYSANKYKAFSTWSINMLMEWTRLDPVSEKETKRNEAVYGIQGNRNPFIDHPELAEYIWGDKQGEAWNGGADPVPAITAPQSGLTFNMGSVTVGNSLDYKVYIKGEALTQDVNLEMTDNENFAVDAQSFTAAAVNGGLMLTVTFSPSVAGEFNNKITLSSSEATTWFTVIATAKDGGEPGPDPVLGDSIKEDWEGCTTGGYWNDIVAGHTWSWDFNNAGIFSDNLRRGQLSCRLGKTSTSSITMREDVAGGIGAIAVWAGSYGSDPEATLQVDYSTDMGSTWTTAGSITTSPGSLNRYLVNVGVEDPVRFRIMQTAGTRVNLDDITLYKLVKTVTVKGDVNGDGVVNISDINVVIDLILKGAFLEAADVNDDDTVNVGDINAIINEILTH